MCVLDSMKKFDSQFKHTLDKISGITISLNIQTVLHIPWIYHRTVLLHSGVRCIWYIFWYYRYIFNVYYEIYFEGKIKWH